MKEIAILLAFICCGPASAASLRLYFSTTGLAGGVLFAPPPEYASHIIPLVTAGTSVFLYASVVDAGTWNGISLDYSATSGGDGTVSLINSQFVGLRRWNPNSDFIGRLNGTDDTNLVAVQELGLPNPYGLDSLDNLAFAGADGTVHFYLGSATITSDGVFFLRVGFSGISRVEGDPATDLIYFGWGDGPVHGNQFGAASTLGDLISAPEPSTGVLFCVIASCAIRQRIRG